MLYTVSDLGSYASTSLGVVSCETYSALSSMYISTMKPYIDGFGGNGMHYMWLDDMDACGWYGISCSEIHDDENQQLFYDMVYFPSNDYMWRGSLPTEIGSLTNYGYEISGTSLYINTESDYQFVTGSIPSQIGKLTEVSGLDFFKLKFSSTIPVSIALFSYEFVELQS